MDDERIGLVLAAGAERVIAWETGVLAGFVDEGFDPRRADVIAGTSAGSLVAARLALGCDPRRDAERLARSGSAPTAPVEDGAARVAELMRLWLSSSDLPLDERRRCVGQLAVHGASDSDEYVRTVARHLPPGAWPAKLRLASVDARSGARVLVDATSGVSVARGVAAARALPGLRPPVVVENRALVDAALGTATNADLLCHGMDQVVVVTAAPAEAQTGTLDGEFAAGLATERSALWRNGVRVTAVHAGERDRAAMGEDLFGVADARGAVAAGRERGRQAAARLAPRALAA